MKGRNHLLMAGAIATLMDLHACEIAYCMAAASLPDHMEKLGRFRVISHRTWTHEVLVWTVPLLVCLFCPGAVSHALEHFGLYSAASYLTFRTWVLFLPGLLHLAGDVFTPKGIRVARRRMALGLFPTGSPLEYVVTALFILIAILYKVG